MAKSPSRRVANNEDLDLTPPEEIRARRIRLTVLLGAIAACLLGVTIYFTARPAAGAIRGWQSRRLAREAFALIDQNKWRDANAKARDALMVRPAEPESWRAIARLASRTNQWSSALEWWKKVDAAHRLTIEDRRDLVGAALVMGDIALAEKQVQILFAQPGGPGPIDVVFAGQIAARETNPLALDYGERALADKRAKPYEILAAATLVLSVTRPDSPPYASAWRQIEDIARDAKNPGSLDALAVLANEQATPPMSSLTNPSLSLDGTSTRPRTAATQESESRAPTGGGATMSSPPQNLAGESTSASTPQTQSGTLTLSLAANPPPAPMGRTMSLTEVATALENHPNARPYHKLLALEVRARQDPVLADQYVADAIERFGNASRNARLQQETADSADETLLALSAWLNKIGRPAKTLEVLPQERASQRPDLFLIYINALAALQRWNEIKEMLLSERFPVEPALQHMYLAVAQMHLGSATAVVNEWQRALQVATTADQLLTLARYAEQNSANDIADSAFAGAIKLTSQNREAYNGRLRLAMAADDTAKAQSIAAEIAQLWPDDTEARNQDAYLRLLLGATGEQAEAAEREAQVLVAKEPRNWLARATLGLARLRLGRKERALAAIRQPRVTGAEPPGPLAVRAAILAANGYEEGARGDAQNLRGQHLLPEERALIAPLLQ